MGFQQLTLNANNFSHNSTISSGDFDNLAITDKQSDNSYVLTCDRNIDGF